MLLIFLLPFLLVFNITPRQQLAVPRIELTWSGPIRDLPLLTPKGPEKEPSPPGEPEKPLPKRGADAFHPRQTIISAPKVPTHPRQTLIQPDAPMEAPKLLPQLPNIVQWPAAPQPAKPKLKVNPLDVSKARSRRKDLPEDAAAPLLPNQEQKAGDLSLATNARSNKPAMPVVAMSAPRAPSRTAGEDVAAPDIGPNVTNGDSSLYRIIAISATPAPPETLADIPLGNLRSNVTLSPLGTNPGSPTGATNGTAGGTGGTGGGPGSPGGKAGGGGGGSGPEGVSISGGSPSATMSGGGTGGIRPNLRGLTPGRVSPGRPEPRAMPGMPEVNPTRPNSSAGELKPGAAPESLLGLKQTYTMHVNMPNLSSATGSWVLHFAEMDPIENSGMPYVPKAKVGTLVAPIPLRKQDPPYPPALMSARIEGEVVLYAIIRKDGSVDSIQLIRSLEPQLDQNAMGALARWKFRPAQREGEPVELEAVVRIPFRVVQPY